VPHLILGIADNLQSARSLSLHELDQLSRNIDHIKQIVAVQQNYAKAGGVLQAFDPLEVFTDAVRITNASITRHQIQLTTEAPPERPAFHADRHLVLQIIVNLLQNAVQSVKVHPPGERFVTLRLSFHDQFLRYAVIDNGVGIEPENTQNIFQHGFTTRKDGHGFGLHSGALAARNLGGSLQVASDGPGRGATFTLELPLEPTSPEQLPRA
jgi:signal transduction histidine kinase